MAVAPISYLHSNNISRGQNRLINTVLESHKVYSNSEIIYYTHLIACVFIHICRIVCYILWLLDQHLYTKLF